VTRITTEKLENTKDCILILRGNLKVIEVEVIVDPPSRVRRNGCIVRSVQLQRQILVFFLWRFSFFYSPDCCYVWKDILFRTDFSLFLCTERSERSQEVVAMPGSVTANSGIMSSRDNDCHPGMTEISMLFWDDNGGQAHVIHGLSKS
jgi:hypothetical protein